MAAEKHVDEETSKNPEKQKRKLKQTILDNFSKIINNNSAVRVKSGVSLVVHLTENKNEENDDKEIKYALGRIIRGLGSSTNNARIGFYSSLVTLLTFNEEISVSDIFECTQKSLVRRGSNSKGENADICSGNILACGAIIRSGLFSKSTEEDKKKVVELLLASGKEKNYHMLLSYMFVTDLLDQFYENELTNSAIFDLIRTEIAKPLNEQTLDSLFLLLSVQKKFPDLVNKKFLKFASFGCEKIICDDSLSRISSILTTIQRVTSINHPIYELFGKQIANSDLLVDFCKELDQHLNKPNRNKHLVIAELLSIILENMTNVELVPKILTDNFINQTVCYFRTLTMDKKDNEFQKSIKEFFDKLLLVLKREGVQSSVKVNVIRRLLFNPGTFIFEKTTRTKIVQDITSTMDVEGIKQLADVYKKVVTGDISVDIGMDTNEHVANKDRLYAAHLVVKLLNMPLMGKEHEWKVEILIFLANLGLFKSSKVGCELSALLKNTFYGALALKNLKLEDIQSVLSSVVKDIDSKLTPENLETVLRSPISEEIHEMWLKMIQSAHKIQKKKKKKGVNQVFLTLFLYMGLQLLNDSTLASDTLKELFACYQRVKKSKKTGLDETTTTDTEETSEETPENDPLWIEVVIDLFLNLLSQNSSVIRGLVGYVFPYLCEHINDTCVQQILSVLDPKNEDNPLVKGGESEEESEDEAEGEESGDDEGSEASEESENDSEEEEEEDDTQTSKLRMALHNALISVNSSHRKTEDDEESIDLDQISDNEAEALDKALADAFKQFRPNRGRNSKKQNKEQEALTHFRIRVLDLVDILVAHNTKLLLSLEIMVPLLQSLEYYVKDEHQTPLVNRIKSSLKQVTSFKKNSSTEGVTDQVLKDLLSSLLEKGTKNNFLIQDIGPEISCCCIYIVKCSQVIMSNENTPHKTKKHLKNGLTDIILEELERFFTKRDCKTPYVLFKNILELSWDGNLSLVKKLLEFSFGSDVKQFKKTQIFELLHIFFSNNRYLALNSKILKKTKDDVKMFGENTVGLFKCLCENPAEKVTEKFLRYLFIVLTSIKCSKIDYDIDWQNIGDLIREYRSNVSFSGDARKSFNKLCSSLKINHIVKMKQKVIKLSNNVDSQEVKESNVEENDKKSKKRKNKESIKLKKESKQLRLQSLSEGFSSRVNFEKVETLLPENYEDLSQNGVDENGTEMLGNDSDTEQKAKIKKKEKKNKKRKNSDSQNGLDETEMLENENDAKQKGKQKKKEKKNKKRKSSESKNEEIEETKVSKKVKKVKKGDT